MTEAQSTAGHRLAQAGLRATPQRLLVLETLAAEPHDATAQEIYSRLRQSGERVGLATVYRTLSLLSEHDVVDEFAHRPGETCYRLCGEGHHHHLVCAGCHGVAELEGCEVDEWLDQAAREHGFAPTGHTLEVTGLCAACQAAGALESNRVKQGGQPRTGERVNSLGGGTPGALSGKVTEA